MGIGERGSWGGDGAAVGWDKGTACGRGAGGTLLVVPGLLLMRRGQLRRSRCDVVRWARAYRAGEALAGALPVVPWLLLLMRRAQLQRARVDGALTVTLWLLLMRRSQLQRSWCAGTLGTGTPCGRDTGRRTPFGSLAAADATSAAAEGTVLWCVGHGHTLRKRRWQAHSL